ncbi:hypothetical protein [Methylomicrobium album]|uniref:Uncharacterized protein n=1 Tax=Methylomicrobium album BG8 TaxID=686340 RepID=H8GQR4_METAL|nr:hypothetical protein [Methylomicrobium album]EIC31049.1 hypothetical protein Metal_3390 [Methylomicrobium album BG8]
MAIKFPPPPYSGSGLLIALDKYNVEQKTKHDLEDIQRMFDLCAELGIEESPFMWYELALTLARKLYPKPQKKGRKSKWTPYILGCLVVELERLAINGKSIDWAADVLSKREPWKSFIEAKESDITDKDPGEALRKLYFKARNDKWAKLYRKAYKWHEINDDIASWEAAVADLLNND